MSERPKRGHPSGKTGRSLLAPEWQDRAKKTMVYGLLSDAWGAYTAPLRAYRGLLDPMSDEAIKNMADLAGMVTLGSGAVPATGKHELRAGIKAYHGSPHDFDKFSMGKIGTGEGAQAYGHGLYFADSEDVARSYRNKLAGDMANAGPGSQMGKELLSQAGGDRQKAMAMLSREFESDIPGYNPMNDPNYRSAMEFLNSAPDGRMYEVNINANPDDFLDWDKPISQQPQNIQSRLGWTPEKVAEYNRLLKIHDDALLASLEDGPMVSMPQSATDAYNRAMAMAKEIGTSFDSTGAGIAKGGSVFDSAADVNKAMHLKERGIPGIKYLDGGSRAAGEGSRNYVVFDENLIEIVKKYGIAGALAAGLLTQEQAKQFTQQQGPTQGEWEAAYKQGRGA